ncbi:MAG: MFS transporter [Candidatus Sumerlaeia bacterium]|nr:MFS transporter [Candidatus Sumerlaeia bacterium]
MGIKVSAGTAPTLYLASSLTVMAAASVAPALPAIGAHFHGTPALGMKLSLLITLPALMTAIFAPLCGWLSDRAGRRFVLICSLWLYTIAGAAAIFLSTMQEIILTRALLGISVALVMTSALGLVADYFDGARRDQVIGRQAAWAAIGGILFPLAGGIFADISWRLAFLPFLLAAPLAIYASRNLPKIARQRTPVKSSVRIQWPIIAVPCMLAFTGMVAFNIFPLKIGFLIQSTQGLTPGSLGVATASGLALGWLSLMAAASSTTFQKLRSILGRRGTPVAFWLLLGFGYLGISFAETTIPFVIYTSIAGIGLGLLMPTVTHLIIEAAKPHQRGALLGVLTTAIFAGQFASQGIADPLHAIIGVKGCFAMVGAVAMLSGIALLALPLLRKKTLP